MELFASHQNAQLQRYVSLPPRSICSGSGRVSNAMVGDRSISVFPIRYDTEVSYGSPAEKCFIGHNSSTIADTTLVSSASNPVVRKPDTPHPLQGPFDVSIARNTQQRIRADSVWQHGRSPTKRP